MTAPEQPTHSEEQLARPPAKNKVPLVIRLYLRPVLTDLVRLLGYKEVEIPTLNRRLTKLRTKHGRDAVDAAQTELLHLDVTRKPVVVARLSDNVRRLARALLGPPPGETPGEIPPPEEHETTVEPSPPAPPPTAAPNGKRTRSNRKPASAKNKSETTPKNSGS